MEIYIGKNNIPAQIDEEDLHLFEKKGNYFSVTNHGYVRIMVRSGMYPNGYYKYSNYYLHRLVMDAQVGLQVDHINGDRLDNRKENLRLCTNASNSRNSVKKKGNYKGVHYNKNRRKWVAQITKDYKCYTIGSFNDEVDAARAYNNKAKEFYGEFAKLNNV